MALHTKTKGLCIGVALTVKSIIVMEKHQHSSSQCNFSSPDPSTPKSREFRPTPVLGLFPRAVQSPFLDKGRINSYVCTPHSS